MKSKDAAKEIAGGGLDRKLQVSRLEQAMRDKGLKAGELAQQIGVSRSAMSYIKAGKRQPSRVTLGRMANVLSVTIDYLVGQSDTFDSASLLNNPKIHQLIELFQGLNDRDQQRVLDIVKLMYQTALGSGGNAEAKSPSLPHSKTQ